MNEQNYTVYHLHSDLSNGVTNIDSVTKYTEYIQAAADCGMKAMAFSEHGSVFSWYSKKEAIEKAGMKYLHAEEFYVTESLVDDNGLPSKVRDNYHCVLIAKDFDGVMEINRLSTKSFNRNDGSFFYVPRITFEDLAATTQHVIITTACIGGILAKGSESLQNRFLSFLEKNKDRCFLEIQHHNVEKQIVYNKKLLQIKNKTGIPLIAGTDTHCLNKTHEEGRKILQESKQIFFGEEDGWDLTFKTYDELCESYKRQNSIPEKEWREAMENTNAMADMVSSFEMDRHTKYPHLYENPTETFRKKIEEARANHPFANKRYPRDTLDKRIEEELSVYEKVGAVDFMLLETYIREWERKNGIQSGYGRGSVSGSMIAYLLGITQMDSIRFDLNFFRFMSPERVSNADIDTDYGAKDRDKIKEFLLKDHLGLSNIKTSEIITFNTIALKGAVKDVCRALKIPLSTAQEISDACYMDDKKQWTADEKIRSKYNEVFCYADIVSGTVVSVGSHPCGVLINDGKIEETVGLCSIKTSDYPVSMLDMHDLDTLMYVKLDVLGLDNIGVINQTCQYLGIERMTPDTVDLDDEAVWKSIRDDTTGIFQWESDSARAFIKKFMQDSTVEKVKADDKNFSYIKWFSLGNSLIRPSCSSFRDDVSKGLSYDNGFKELDDFLKPERGHVCMQETIMQFLVRFCGYSNGESDTVRRAIAKKKGTEKLLPEIERRFCEYSSTHYDISFEKCQEVIKPFLQVILDASAYGFSANHSDSYSCIGYICGYLRYYYPVEFLTASLNTFKDDTEKTADIIKYAKKIGIRVTTPKFGISGSDYSYNAASKTIAKGLQSLKFFGEGVASEIHTLSQKKTYKLFTDVIFDLYQETHIDTRQLDTLIKIDFFSDFGNQRELFRINEVFEQFGRGTSKQIKRDKIDGTLLEPVVRAHATWTTKSGAEAKSYTLKDPLSILHETEVLIEQANIPDLPVLIKARNFKDVTGYAGYVSGQEMDRPILFVKEIYPLKRKKDGKQFGYSLITSSLGSGIETRFTVFNRVFDKEPVRKDDVIRCTGFTRDGQYFTMTSYSKCLEE